MRLIIDAKTGQKTSAFPASVRNRMSWRRLADALIAGGHVAPHETLTHLIVEDDGLHLCFEIKINKKETT